MSTALDSLLQQRGLRSTAAARAVLAWLLANPDQAFTHAELMQAVPKPAAEQKESQKTKSAGLPLNTTAQELNPAWDKVTLYRLLDRLLQARLVSCHVDAQRVRHFQAVMESKAQTSDQAADPATAISAPHFECQACHRSIVLPELGIRLEPSARQALQALMAVGYSHLSWNMAFMGMCVDCSPQASAAMS